MNEPSPVMGLAVEAFISSFLCRNPFTTISACFAAARDSPKRKWRTYSGVPHPSQISRMERSVREPNLPTLLAYELLFRTPGRRLFAGVQEEVEKRTPGRAKRLLARLNQTTASAQLERKRETLQALIEGQVEILGLPT